MSKIEVAEVLREEAAKIEKSADRLQSIASRLANPSEAERMSRTAESQKKVAESIRKMADILEGNEGGPREFEPQKTMVRLKSDVNRVMIVTDVTRSGQVRCNWHEPGNDSWISAWFDPSELEEVGLASSRARGSW